MKNAKLKMALASLAMGLGIAATSSAVSARESGTCLLFKDRCEAGIIFYCQQYANQCPDEG